MKKKMLGRVTQPSLNAWLVLLLAVFVILPLAEADAQKKGKTPPEKVPDTLILVSTFAETGQTLRGARVRLYPADAEGHVVKGKALEGQTNHVGEYPFHVPKTDAMYVLVAEMKGFTRTEKPVKVQGEDQLDVFLQLPVKQ